MSGIRIIGGASTSHCRSDASTHVELTWVEKKIEYWIRFGRETHEQILDRRRRVLSFAPGSIFAFVRWAANDFGTVVSRIDVVRTVASGEPYQTLPFVRPGGDILLKIDVEGYEPQVIRGAEATLSRALFVSVEVHFREYYKGRSGRAIADAGFSSSWWRHPAEALGLAEGRTGPAHDRRDRRARARSDRHRARPLAPHPQPARGRP